MIYDDWLYIPELAIGRCKQYNVIATCVTRAEPSATQYATRNI